MGDDEVNAFGHRCRYTRSASSTFAGDMEAVVKTIRQLREERGWTQDEPGRTLGVTNVTVYNWERDRHMPTVVQFREIAKVSGVRMEDIALVGVDVGRGEQRTNQ